MQTGTGYRMSRTTNRRSHKGLALLTVVLATQIAAPCESGDPPPPTGIDEVRLEPPILSVEEPTYYSGTADILVTTEGSVQAVDLQLTIREALRSFTQAAELGAQRESLIRAVAGCLRTCSAIQSFSRCGRTWSFSE